MEKTHSAPDANKQITALTSTRFFAAILVVVHHFGTTVAPFSYAADFFSNGNLCVSYFFVLSGFILCYVNADKHIDYRSFITKRAARILPMYYVALGLQVAILLYLTGTVAGFRFPLATSALLIQAFVRDHAVSLNMPAWSLSVEAFFYLLFPLLFLWQKRSIRAFIISTVVLYAASQLLLHYYYPYDEAKNHMLHCFLFFNPLMHVNQFMIGILAGYFFLRRRGGTSAQRNMLLLPLLGIIAIACAFRPSWLSYQAGLLAPLFALLIVLVAAADPRFLRWKPLVVLGEASYSIYILHYPFYHAAGIVNAGLLGEQALFYVYLPALVLVSVFCYYFIEIPMRRKITAFFLRRDARVAPRKTG